MIPDKMNNILSVSELTEAIKKQLETRFPLVAVKGEISNLKEQSSGHLYFTLKDETSQISSVLFRGNAQSLQRRPKNGDQVIARGELSVYPPRGNYQVIVRSIEFSGIGELLTKLHLLKTKLQDLGWFDAKHKKNLPYLPKKIGIVTSPTGAVIRDILHILNRRFSNVHVLLNPVKVQGEGAAKEIAKAIDDFNTYQLADVLIVGRGGGSLEDLWAFNEECVASAIFRSQIPIISAVGHETDVTIADFVADIRAPTPSAAAEIVIAEKEAHLKFLTQAQERCLHAIHHTLEACLQRSDDLNEKVGLLKSQFLREKKKSLQALQSQVALCAPSALLNRAKLSLKELEKQQKQALSVLLHQKRSLYHHLKQQIALCSPLTHIATLKEKIAHMSAHLQSLHPKNLLKQGYAILFRENSASVIFSAKDISVGDTIEIEMHDGKLKGKIYEV